MRWSLSSSKQRAAKAGEESAVSSQNNSKMKHVPSTATLSRGNSISSDDDPFNANSSTAVRSLGTGVLSSNGNVWMVGKDDKESKETKNTPETIVPVPDLPKHVLLGGEAPHSYHHVNDAAEYEYQTVLSVYHALSEQDQADVNANPTILIRHVRAEKGHVAHAIAAVQRTLAWRRAFGVKQIIEATSGEDVDLKNTLELENETGKIYVRGYDQDGRALLYMRPQRENTFNELHNMQHLVWNLEKAVACTKRQSQLVAQEAAAKNPNAETQVPPQPLEKIVLLIDYTGYQFKHTPPLSTSKYTLDILQKHYPERLQRAYVLHPPRVFTAFWTIVRPLLDPATKDKIVFCSGEPSLEKVRSVVAKVDKLEPVAGGTCAKEFNSKEYMNLPFDQSFDE